MEEVNHNVQLTSAEVANLWSQYMNDSMASCVLKYYIKCAKDQDIKEVLQYALELAERHLDKIKSFLSQEKYPIPVGFNDNDVDLNAKPLFSDKFIIFYIHIMTIHGLTGYAGAVSTSIRSDQIDYFVKCSKETMELHKRITKVMVEKGIISRPPSITPAEDVDFVTKQSFLTGWFGDRRPLTAIEASGVYFNMKKDVLKIALELGFSQVAESKEIRNYVDRGKKICEKQFDILDSIMSDNDISSPPRYNDEVLSTTKSPFSDKLMLFHIVTLISTASGYYGAAFSVSQRRDLATTYAVLIAEVMKYAEDGMNIMIKNGWMEQPPTFSDRNELKNKNEGN
ncbi:DUF3231 family protein [Salirhabdus salicampi]|uniref:DUF3231 family protein n=1 Tax=Salirhabdus salicampi TaxID=476102 RepID=UPI0020C2FF6A|nr:DUF3231 family protein [Salirhabdus salicampi]MCP8615407.1 DUF3231 family protein [Salirhabdus salicampi]